MPLTYTIFKKNNYNGKYTKLQEVTNAPAIPREGEILRIDMTSIGGSSSYTDYRVTHVIYRMFHSVYRTAVVVEPIDKSEVLDIPIF